MAEDLDGLAVLFTSTAEGAEVKWLVEEEVKLLEMQDE